MNQNVSLANLNDSNSQSESVQSSPDNSYYVEQQLKRRLNDLMSKCVDFEQEQTITDEDIVSLRSEVNRLKEQIDRANFATEQIINEFEYDFEDKNQQIDTTTDYFGNMVLSNSLVHPHCHQISNDLEELNRNQQNEINNLKKELSINSEQLSNVETKNMLLKEQIIALKTEVENMIQRFEDKISFGNQLIVSLKDENCKFIELMNQKHSELETLYSNECVRSSELSTLSQSNLNELEQLKQKLANEIKYRSTLDIENKFFREQMLNAKNEFEKVTNDYESLLESLKKDNIICIEDSNRRYLQLETKYSDELERAISLSQLIIDNQNEIDQVNQNLTNERQYRSKLESVNQTLRNQLNLNQTELNEYRLNLELSYLQIANLKVENNNQIEQEAHKYSELQAKLNDECQKKNNLQHELNSLTEKLQTEIERKIDLEIEKNSLNEKFINLESLSETLIEENNETIKTINDKLALINTELDQHRKVNSELGSQLEQAQTENIDLMAILNQTNNSHKIEISALKEDQLQELQTAQNEIINLKDELVRNQQESNFIIAHNAQEIIELKGKVSKIELKYQNELNLNIQTTESYQVQLKKSKEKDLNRVLEKEEFTSQINMLKQQLTESQTLNTNNISMLRQTNESKTIIENELNDLKQQFQLLKSNEYNTKLSALTEEREKHLIEIENLKSELIQSNK